MIYRNFFCLKVISSVLMALTVAGCGSVGSKNLATIYDRMGVDVIIEPSSGTSFVLTDEKIRDQFCMAPPPDLSDAKSFSDSLAVKGVSVSAGTAMSVAALGGRSPAVLISREIMYRTCELYVNGRFTKDEAISIFKASLDRVIEVTKAQIALGSVTKISSGGADDASVPPSGGGGNGSAPTSGDADDASVPNSGGVANDSAPAASGQADEGSVQPSGGGANGSAAGS